MKRTVALMLLLALLAAVPAARAVDVSVLDTKVYEISDYDDYRSVVTTLSVNELVIRHTHSLPNFPSYVYGELVLAENKGEDVALWCWNIFYKAKKPLGLKALTVTVGGMDFTMDLTENLETKTLEDGSSQEASYVVMGTENTKLWMCLLLEAKAREMTGSFEGWTMPAVIHGAAEDVETAFTTAVMVDLYAAYLAMDKLGLTSCLADFEGTPAACTEAAGR